jgi:hypothetical protein
MLVELVDSHG